MISHWYLILSILHSWYNMQCIPRPSLWKSYYCQSFILLLWYYILRFFCCRRSFSSEMKWSKAALFFSWYLSYFLLTFTAGTIFLLSQSNQVASRESDIHQVVTDLGWNEFMVSHGNLTCSLLVGKTTIQLLAKFLCPEF